MKRTLTTLLGGAAALALLVGCGSDGRNDASAASSSTETASEFPRSGGQTYSTPQDLVNDLAAGGITCTDFLVSKPSPLDDPGQQNAMCRFPATGTQGAFFTVSTYPSEAARQTGAPTPNPFSQVRSLLVQGGNWIVSCSTRYGNDCQQIQAVLGGTLTQ